MKLSRILIKAIDYLTECPKRMCGSNSNNGKGVNKLIAPYDISEASIRHQLVSFGKEPLYSDRSIPIYKTNVIPSAWCRYTSILREHHTRRRRQYIRTLIHVLSLVLRDQSS